MPTETFPFELNYSLCIFIVLNIEIKFNETRIKTEIWKSPKLWNFQGGCYNNENPCTVFGYRPKRAEVTRNVLRHC